MDYRLTFSEEHPHLVIAAISFALFCGGAIITLASVGFFTY
jgi:hypothetical protein